MKTRVLYVCGAAIVIAAALGQLGAQGRARRGRQPSPRP